MKRILKYLSFALFFSCNSGEDSFVIAAEQYQSVDSIGNDNQISFLHISDTHGSDISIRPMIEALNNSDCDFAVITGDILPSESTIDYIASSEKPVLMVIGNHDAYDGYGQNGFRENVLNRMKFPNIVYGDPNACYYHIDFYKKNYSLRVICLDQYEIDTEGRASKNCSVISQKQMDWFIRILAESVYFTKVIVLMHQGFGNASIGKRNLDNSNAFISIFAKDYPRGYYHIGNTSPFMIPDILNAYLTGVDMVNKVYPTGYKKEEILVNTHFEKPHANFVGFFGGHIHMDCIEYLPYYENQLQVLMAYSGKGTGSRWNDLVKTGTGDASYNFNCNVVDFKNSELKIYRYGAKLKVDSTMRDSIIFPLKHAYNIKSKKNGK